MSVLYQNYATVSGKDLYYTITDSLKCTIEREYVTTPLVDASGQYVSSRGNESFWYTEHRSGTFTEYDCIIENETTHVFRCSNTTPTVRISYQIGTGTVNTTYLSYYFPDAIVYTVSSDYNMVFASNIPIFLATDIAYANIYKNHNATLEQRNEALRHAINYSAGDTTPDGKYIEFSQQWTTSTWDSDTQPIITGQPNYLGFRGKITNGSLSFYVIDGIDNGALKLGIKTDATFYNLEYSTDGYTWNTADNLPYNFVYRKRNNELGTFSYALSFVNSEIPIFTDEETAQDYLNGEVDITQAINWGDISQNYPIINNTADSDDATTMGEVYTRAFFSQQYICSWQAIQQISNALFDIDSGGLTGIWDDIKRGLEMYGQNPIDAVQSCMFYPVDLTTVFTNVQNQNYIYFGGYKFVLQDGVTVDKIIYPNGSYDFGTFYIASSFGGSWRDYSPYQRLYVYLCYIGWCELDIARYINRNVNVKYYFDTRTGMCLACLFTQTSDGWLLQDYFNGQCGVSMPLTLTDFSNYATAQIQTLLGVGNGQIQNASNIGNMASDLAQKGVGASAIATASVSLGAVGVGIGATKVLYGLTQNNINNFNKTKGGSSSMLNMFLPQEVCFMIETQDADITPNELSLMGYPSNASGRLNDFSGYLEVDTVNLVCPYATENEKAEIVGLLKSGVYI